MSFRSQKEMLQQQQLEKEAELKAQLTIEQQQQALIEYEQNKDQWQAEYEQNKDNRNWLEQTVIDFVKKDPIKAVETVKNPLPQVVTQVYKLRNGDKNVGLLNDEWNKTVLKNDSIPEVTKTIGDTGPIVKESGETVVNTVTDTTKKYLPIIVLGAGALFLISAFK